MSAVRYTVELLDPNAHLFRVRCRVPRPDPQGQVFALPSWIRGSYLVRDFAKHVIAVRAGSGDAAVAFTRLDKRRLRCASVAGELWLESEVYAFDRSVRKAYLDTFRGFFNPSSLCYRALDADADGCELELPPPRHPACTGWRVFTAAAAVACDDGGWGRYRFPDYEALLDTPFELGAHRRLDFAVDGIPHCLVLAGDGEGEARRFATDGRNRFERPAEDGRAGSSESRPSSAMDGRYDHARLAADLTAICAAQRSMFGGEPKTDRYVFLCTLTANGYGGLEHRSSAALIAARDALPRPAEDKLRKGYRDFLGLVSHEYFHQWNVKRITPRALAESDLGEPAYTRDLWAYEGVTSYYDDLFLLRAGRIDAAIYLDLLAQAATRVQRAPGHAVQTLADASFEAWIKYYQPDEDSSNSTVSYYLKGALVALCLDLLLRRDSAISLDDVMRALWQRYGATGDPAPEGALETLAAECSGLDLRAFFNRALRSTEPLPLAELLADFGVAAELRPARGAEDLGGRNGGGAAPPAVDLGLRRRERDTALAFVRRGGPAERAGLAAEDVLIAFDGERLTSANWNARLEALRPQRPVQVTFFRDQRLHQTILTPAPPSADTWTLTLAEAAPAAAQRRRRWLGS